MRCVWGEEPTFRCTVQIDIWVFRCNVFATFVPRDASRKRLESSVTWLVSTSHFHEIIFSCLASWHVMMCHVSLSHWFLISSHFIHFIHFIHFCYYLTIAITTLTPSRWWCQRLSVQNRQYMMDQHQILRISMEFPDFGSLFIEEPELKEKDGGQDATDVMQVKGWKSQKSTRIFVVSFHVILQHCTVSNVSWTSLATFWSSWIKAMEQGNDEQVASVTPLDFFADGPVVHLDASFIQGSHGSGSCRSEPDVFRTASQGNIWVILAAVSDSNSRSNLKGVKQGRTYLTKTLKDPCWLRGTRAPGRLCMALPCLHLWLAWTTRVAWQQTMCDSAA